MENEDGEDDDNITNQSVNQSVKGLCCINYYRIGLGIDYIIGYCRKNSTSNDEYDVNSVIKLVLEDNG